MRGGRAGYFRRAFYWVEHMKTQPKPLAVPDGRGWGLNPFPFL